MNFFESQERARSRTRLLVFLFVVSTSAVAFATYVPVRWVLDDPRPRELALTVATVALVILGGSFWKTAQLRRGGRAIAERLGGRAVPPNAAAIEERRLRNVVEEMAIAAGLGVPAIYVLPEEDGINAFAAGWTPDDAAIAVTRGALERLTRDELQAVVAHEFSHVLNGDMRLNIRLIGLLHGLLAIGLLGRFLIDVSLGTGARRERRSSDRGVPLHLLVLGLAILAIGSLGVFLGRLIKAAVSRQREVLADASAVQFTRNKAALASALKKIGGMAFGSVLITPHAEEASHLFIADGLPKYLNFRPLFATHPPLEERIRALEPSWDGRFLPPVREAPPAPRPPIVGGPPIAAEALGALSMPALAIVAERAAKDRAAAAPPADGAGQPRLADVPIERLVEEAGAPRAEHVAYGADLLAGLPEEVRAAAHDPFLAQALACALLLARDPAVRAAQIEALRPVAPAGLEREVAALAPLVDPLPRGARLPLVDLLLPALRECSPAQAAAFERCVEAAIDADPRVGLFAWTLRKVLLKHLARGREGGARRGPAAFYSTRAVAHECAVILSVLARAGATSEGLAAAAFAEAARRLNLRGVGLLPPARCTLGAFDRALDRLAGANAGTKAAILHACARCVGHDGVLHPAEAELLRAVADALDCPIPPMVGAGAGATTTTAAS